MTKNELRDRIKSIVKKVYSTTTSDSTDKVDLDSPEAISLDTARFPVLEIGRAHV
jgi:hypothetical protein